jgi:hypothetical protein
MHAGPVILYARPQMMKLEGVRHATNTKLSDFLKPPIEHGFD